MNIQLHEVTKRFGSRVALHALEHSLPCRGLTVVGGPNGAGKSVLLKILAGVVAPTSGQLLWDGVRVDRTRLTAYKFRIGYMPQEPAFYEGQSAQASLAYFARLKGIPSGLVETRVRQILRIVHLDCLARRPVKHLSEGERARLALGVALLNDPDLLLLDEPGSKLDPGQRIELWELLAAIKSTRSVVMATHLFAGLEGIVDHVVILEDGRLLYTGSADALLAEVAPYVWEVRSTLGKEPTWSSPIRVVSHRRQGSETTWRLLASTPPCAGARRAAPALDDAYLWLRWCGRSADVGLTRPTGEI